MFLRLIFLFFTFMGVTLSHASSNASPKVLASLHPLALIAAAAVEPAHLSVLVPKGRSPHNFSLKPSDIKRIKHADIIVWAGADIEPYLAHFAANQHQQIWLDISQIPLQTPINDPHKWLSIEAATKLQQQLSQHLQQPNRTFVKQMAQVKAQLHTQLRAYQKVPFFVFHRAYDYWVSEFHLSQQMTFSEHAQHKAGLNSVLKMRKMLEQQKVHCIFSEAQFSDAIVRAVIGNLNVTQVELDPMGYQFSPSKHAYAEFLLDMGKRFQRCLSHTEKSSKKNSK